MAKILFSKHYTKGHADFKQRWSRPGNSRQQKGIKAATGGLSPTIAFGHMPVWSGLADTSGTEGK
jgi:hypothetical protein